MSGSGCGQAGAVQWGRDETRWHTGPPVYRYLFSCPDFNVIFAYAELRQLRHVSLFGYLLFLARFRPSVPREIYVKRFMEDKKKQ